VILSGKRETLPHSEALDSTDAIVAGKKNDAMKPVARTRLHKNAAGKTNRLFRTTIDTTTDAAGFAPLADRFARGNADGLIGHRRIGLEGSRFRHLPRTAHAAPPRAPRILAN